MAGLLSRGRSLRHPLRLHHHPQRSSERFNLISFEVLKMTKQPETGVDQLRREMEKKLIDQQRRIELLEGQVKKIISNINSSPGKRIL